MTTTVVLLCCGGRVELELEINLLPAVSLELFHHFPCDQQAVVFLTQGSQMLDQNIHILNMWLDTVAMGVVLWKLQRWGCSQSVLDVPWI